MKKILILTLSLFVYSLSFAQTNTVHKMDYYKLLVGNWEGSGFITDSYGVRQDVNVRQNVSIKSQIMIVSGIFENSATGFKADFMKQFYYNTATRNWQIKVYFENKYYQTTKLSLSDNYTLIYTFKDTQGIMNRATIYAAFPYGWTEMLETWTGQDWEIKRRIMLRKMVTIPATTKTTTKS